MKIRPDYLIIGSLCCLSIVGTVLLLADGSTTEMTLNSDVFAENNKETLSSSALDINHSLDEFIAEKKETDIGYVETTVVDTNQYIDVVAENTTTTSVSVKTPQKTQKVTTVATTKSKSSPVTTEATSSVSTTKAETTSRVSTTKITENKTTTKVFETTSTVITESLNDKESETASTDIKKDDIEDWVEKEHFWVRDSSTDFETISLDDTEEYPYINPAEDAYMHFDDFIINSQASKNKKDILPQITRLNNFTEATMIVPFDSLGLLTKLDTSTFDTYTVYYFAYCTQGYSGTFKRTAPTYSGNVLTINYQVDGEFDLTYEGDCIEAVVYVPKKYTERGMELSFDVIVNTE